MADPEHAVDFPESVVQLFHGDLGLPPEPWPSALQQKILRGKTALTERPGASLAAVDLEAERAKAEADLSVKLGDADLASHLMYPKVFKDYVEHQKTYGDVSALPTTTFFYGLAENDEISVDIDTGKTLVIRLQGRTDLAEGASKLFFELNGQPRAVRVQHAGVAAANERRKAAEGNASEVGAPMPGTVARLAVQPGQRVAKGETLLSLEAMKMETLVAAAQDGVVKAVHVHAGDLVKAGDLLIELASG